MPMFRRRRVAGRKYPKVRGYRRRALPLIGRSAYQVRRKFAANTIRIVRKGITAHVYNNVAGTDFATNSSWLTLGGKSAVAGALPNYYNLPFSAAFRVSDIYNWIELQPIAEKFKLNYVKIYAYATSTTASVNGLGQCPTLLWDTTAEDDTPPTYAAFKEQMGIKRKFLAQGAVAVLKPKLVGTGMMQSGTAGVYSMVVQKPKWLDTNSVSAATEHYGLNGVIEDFLLTSQATAVIDIKFDIEMGISLMNIK